MSWTTLIYNYILSRINRGLLTCEIVAAEVGFLFEIVMQKFDKIWQKSEKVQMHVMTSYNTGMSFSQNIHYMAIAEVIIHQKQIYGIMYATFVTPK